MSRALSQCFPFEFVALSPCGSQMRNLCPGMDSFQTIGVKQWLISALKTLGISSPTPVQKSCIPAILEGRNVIASAETGTGKTAAFVLPILQKLSEDPFGVYAVILTPTRELAFQISQQVTALGARIAVRQHVLVGGVDELSQALFLKKRPHIVIATPGRISTMITRESVDLSRARFVVLDEADQLLDPCYLQDLKLLLDACSSPSRQTLMFSATMTPSMELLHDSVSGDGEPETKDTNTYRFDARENRFATVDQLTQEYIFMPVNLKECYLVHLLKVVYPKSSVIIFTSRCEVAELLLTLLKLLGMKKVTALHSDMKQVDRIEALQKFKGGNVRALIATDVASRGLDIPACELVFNFDVPRTVTTYVHRVGRTARAGRSGRAISFITQNDVDLLHTIENNVGRKIDKHMDLSDEQVLADLSATLKAKQLANMSLHDNGFIDRNKSRRAESRKAGKKRKRNGTQVQSRTAG